MKTSLSFFALALAAFCHPAEITLRFPQEGDREVWVLDQIPDRMPAAGRAFKAKTFPVTVNGNSQVIVVHDPETASVAIRRAGDIDGSWSVSDKDWRAATVTIEAFMRGNPLDGGRAGINSANFSKSVEIENGKAIFFGVPYGEVTVTVDYEGGGIPPTTPQVFRLTKQSKPEDRVLGVTVVADPASETGPKASEPQAQEKPNPSAPWYVNAALWLVGLAVAVVGLLYLMKFLKERSDVVEEKLKGLGVPVPSDLGQAPVPDDDGPAAKPFEAPPVVPAGHCAYCGKPQSECICRLDAPKSVAASGEPELIGVGVDLRIPEGESVVGREGDLRIVDPTVSRQHAKLTREGGVLKVEDLGSANGTYVDGVRIEAETELKPGSTVYFGSVKVRLEA